MESPRKTYKTQEYEVIYIDLEAARKFNSIFNGEKNNITKEHFILQLAAVRCKNGKIDYFNEYCRYGPNLTKKMESIDFFREQKYSEKTVLEKFINFSKNSKYIFCYGSYDQQLINNAIERYGINKKIEIIDISEDVIELFENKKIIPSLKNLINAFNLNSRNSHDALDDAISLYKVHNIWNDLSISNNEILNKLYEEWFRPVLKSFDYEFIKEVIEDKIDELYKIAFITIKTKDEEITNIHNVSEDLGNNEIINSKNDINATLSIKIFNHYTFDLIKEYKVDFIYNSKKSKNKFILDYISKKFHDDFYNTVFVLRKTNYILESYRLKHGKKIIFLNYVLSLNKIDEFFKFNKIEFKNENDYHKFIIQKINNFFNKPKNNFSKD